MNWWSVTESKEGLKMFGVMFTGARLGITDMMGNDIHEGDILAVNFWNFTDLIAIVQYDHGGFYPFADSSSDTLPDGRDVLVLGSVYEPYEPFSLENIRNEVDKALEESKKAEGTRAHSSLKYNKCGLEDISKHLHKKDRMEIYEDGMGISCFKFYESN